MAIAASLCWSLCLVPAARAAGGPSIAALKVRISQDKTQEVPLLRHALGGQGLALDERVWVRVQLAKALAKEKKLEEALGYLRQAAAEAGAAPIARVYVARHLIAVLVDLDQRPQAQAEFSRIAPMLPGLSGKLGSLDGPLEAAEAWLVGGTVMMSLGRLPDAMDVLLRALRVFEARGDARGQASCLNQISLLYSKTGNIDGALREVERAIGIARQGGAHDIMARLYLRKAYFLGFKGRLDEQYESLLLARAQARLDGNTFNLAVIATNLADVALQKKDYRGTLRFVEEAMPLVQSPHMRESLLICWINKGIALNRLGRHEGLALIRQAIAELTAMPGREDSAAEAQGSLAQELARNGGFEQAYAAAVDFKRRSDELRRVSDEKRIADSAARYRAEKQQRQIEVLEQEQRSQRRMQWLWGLAGALGLLTVVVLIIGRLKLKRAYRKVEEMSLSDPLTGLRNRRYLASRIEGDLAQAGRHRTTHERTGGALAGANADVVFIMLDIDHFKSVNDVHGHGAGDAVLRQFSAILMQELRDADTVVRWGGEEFLIVAKQACCADIHLLAERVRARVAAYGFDIGNGTVLRKTCSIGFAGYPFAPAHQCQPRWEDVAALADQCLYAAKTSGRDMWAGIVPATAGGRARVEHSPGRTLAWPEGQACPVAAATESTARVG